MTPDQISSWLSQNLHRFDGPEQWLGDEPGTARKDWYAAEVTTLLAASWPYFHAAGNMSLPCVYAAINKSQRGNYLADRSYLPLTKRDMGTLERAGLGVFGIESRREARQFDIVATSISYIVLLQNFHKQLAMSGIPPRRTVRQAEAERWPFILIGGQSYANPGPLEAIADCIWCGEVEDEEGNPGGISDVLAVIAMFKAAGAWDDHRMACYTQLAQEFNHLYFPHTVELQYGYVTGKPQCGPEPSKQVLGYTAARRGIKLPVVKRFIHDIDSIPPLTELPLLYSDPGFGAGDLEAQRGCPAWCSFCRLSWSTKPFRQRSVPYMRKYAEEFQLNMGSVELSPFGPDFPFGTNKKRLLAELLSVNEHVDSSTMRVDDFIADKDFILLSAIGGMDTVTLGLEGNCLARKETVFIPGRGILTMEEAAAAGSGFQVSCGAHAYPVRRAWKSGERDLVRVRFSDGRWLTCTPEHRVAVTRPDTSRFYNGQREALDCGSAEWVQAADLVPGERVRTFYGQECWGPAQPLLPVHVPRAGQAASRRLELPPVLTPELAWLLGLLATDGNMTPNSARWHVDDDGVEARVREYCQELFGREPTVDRGRSAAAGGARMRRLNISSRPLVRWLELNFGLRKGDCRKVPRQVRQGGREVAQAFITGVFDGDGWVGREDPQRPSWGISQAGECEDFHRDLMALLANLGLHCTRRRQEPGGEWGNQYRWSLRVSAEDGYDWDWFRPAESSRAAAWYPPLSPRKKVLWMAPAEGHAYAEVVAVDPLEGAAHPVYDIEVPETAAFTTGGVVVHNSQRMRDLVGKGTSDAEVEEAVTRGIRAGIRRFKLYMITNMPGEETGDVMRIVALAERLAAIRDSLAVPGVRIQFSWTPLLIEANTPFQWFAPTAADHTLIQVAAKFRDLGIDFKIGTKGDPNKLALFQLCQRASRDAGEAVCDVWDALATATWGGVARDMRERLDAALRNRGFKNGFGDLFDERGEGDLFGWEFISTGISPQLMWDTFRQMREFAEQTDAETYDSQVDGHYHGQEWVAKCGEACQGNYCGVCGKDDLVKRAAYIKEAALEDDVVLTRVRPVDQSSVALRIRALVMKPATHRFVTAEHWRYAIRRAAYRAARSTGVPGSIAKRTIVFGSDTHRYKDWSAGVDYVEFGWTRRLTRTQAARLIEAMAAELDPWLGLRDFDLYPARSSLRADAGYSLYHLPVPFSADALTSAIAAFGACDYVKLVVHTDPTSYFAGPPEEVNARDLIGDVWVTGWGHQLALRFYARGKAGAYSAAAAILGKPSPLALTGQLAMRLGMFEAAEPAAGDLLRPACGNCGIVIPAGLLGEPCAEDFCPRCADEQAGTVLTGLHRTAAV